MYSSIKRPDIKIACTVCIVLGILFCIWPGTILMVLCRITGILLIIAGAAVLAGAASKCRSPRKGSGTLALSLLPGIVMLLMGIFLSLRPGAFLILIPIFIGIILILLGMKNLIINLETASGALHTASSANRITGRWVGFLLAALQLVLGVILLLYAWLAVEAGTILIGIFLIYGGVSGIFIDLRGK